MTMYQNKYKICQIFCISKNVFRLDLKKHEVEPKFKKLPQNMQAIPRIMAFD